MKEAPQQIPLQKYLEPLLKSGLPEEIAAARKTYWRIYKANWRKQRRKEQKEYAISFDRKELNIVAAAAHKHKRCITKFIKEAVLAYCASKFLIVDVPTHNKVIELLALNYNALQQLSDDAVISEEQGMALLQRSSEMEMEILSILNNPQKL
jgi:hypothetical protein